MTVWEKGKFRSKFLGGEIEIQCKNISNLVVELFWLHKAVSVHFYVTCKLYKPLTAFYILHILIPHEKCLSHATLGQEAKHES